MSFSAFFLLIITFLSYYIIAAVLCAHHRRVGVEPTAMREARGEWCVQVCFCFVSEKNMNNAAKRKGLDAFSFFFKPPQQSKKV